MGRREARTGSVSPKPVPKIYLQRGAINCLRRPYFTRQSCLIGTPLRGSFQIFKTSPLRSLVPEVEVVLPTAAVLEVVEREAMVAAVLLLVSLIPRHVLPAVVLGARLFVAQNLAAQRGGERKWGWRWERGRRRLRGFAAL